MAALVSRKRVMNDISTIDPAKLNLQIFCSVRNSEDASGLKKIFAVAQIATSGGIRCDFVKRVGKEEITSIAKLEACLIQRGHRNFHEICDTESQEVADMSVALFDINGRMENPLRDVVSRPEDCDHGSLFYLSSVTVDKKVQGKDIGLLLTHAVMKALRDKWTLALTFPAPLYPDRSPDAKPDAFEIAIAKVSRYFARIGFVQVCGDKPHDLNKYWALEKSKLGDVISVTKAESSSIVVQADIPPVKLGKINEELRDVLLTLSRLSNGSEMSQQSKDALADQLAEMAELVKMHEDRVTETLKKKEMMRAEVEKALENLSELRAQTVLAVNAFTAASSSETDEAGQQTQLEKLEMSINVLARIDEQILHSKTVWESFDEESAESLVSKNEMETCLHAFGVLNSSAESSQMQKFRTAMLDVIRRGGDVNEAKVLHIAVANHFNVSMIEMLVHEYGAQVNQQDSNGFTPLHMTLCVIDTDVNIINTLLKLGADKNIVNNEGKTPAQTGRDNKKRTEKILRSMGIANLPRIPGQLDVIEQCIDLLK